MPWCLQCFSRGLRIFVNMWGADDNPKGKTVKHIKLHLIGIGMLPGKTNICLMALKNFNVVVPTFQVKGKRICTPREIRHSCFPVFIFKVSSRVKNNHFSKFTIFRRLNRAHQELSLKKKKKKSRKKCFLCADLWSSKATYFSWSLTSPVIRDTRAAVDPS